MKPASTPRLWKFKYEEPGIEVPKLTAFIEDIETVCKTHGLSFFLESGYGDEDMVLIVPYEKGDLDFLTDNIKDAAYTSGIPWLREAYQEYNNALEKLRVEKAEAERKRLEAIAAKAAATKEAKLKAEGLILSDGRYRLVKEGE